VEQSNAAAAHDTSTPVAGRFMNGRRKERCEDRRNITAARGHHQLRGSASRGETLPQVRFAVASFGLRKTVINATPAANPPTCAAYATPPPPAGSAELANTWMSIQ
jgi:hypothetical protein